MKFLFFIAIIGLMNLSATSFGQSIIGESKTQKLITIGTQVWNCRNLTITTFNNGDPIYEAKTNEEWNNASEKHIPAWCYFNNDPKTEAKYGKLYNWYVVNDYRGIAPIGYHIPTYNDWEKLISYLGGRENAADNIPFSWNKLIDTLNRKKFSNHVAGNRKYDGEFSEYNCEPYWSKDDDTELFAHFVYIRYWLGDILNQTTTKGDGCAIRFLKN